jgi:hypothetical protein
MQGDAKVDWLIDWLIRVLRRFGSISATSRRSKDLFLPGSWRETDVNIRILWNVINSNVFNVILLIDCFGVVFGEEFLDGVVFGEEFLDASVTCSGPPIQSLTTLAAA